MQAPSRITASLASAIGNMKGSSGASLVPATRRMRPVVEYPSPSMLCRRPTVTSSRAVIWFRVSVPVLSEQMAEVEPRVSTDRSRLTMAPFSARARVPPESSMVTTAGRPVGMAATARLMPTRKSVSKSSPRTRPSTMIRTRAAAAMIVISTVIWSSCLVSGVFSCSTPLSMAEMWPTSLAMPVSVTTISPRPRVTCEFMYAMSTRSPSGTSLPGTGSTRFGDRRALSGEPRLLDLQRRRHQDPAVRRHLVAGLEADDVPGDQVLGRDLDDLAVALDAGGDDQHLPQRGDALGGLALLVQAHHGVEHGQAEDDQPGRDVLERDDADDGRSDQDQLHQVAVLAQKRPPGGLLRLLGQLVRPVPLPPLAPRPN